MLYEIFWVVVRIVGVVVSVLLGSAMTVGLFYFMHTLIISGDPSERRIDAIRVVDATMPEIEMEVIEEIDEPEPIEPVVDLPDLKQKDIVLNSGPSLNVERAEIEVGAKLDISLASVSEADSEYLPLVVIAPAYPEVARKLRIEGWCIVKFTVDSQGLVVADTIEVVDAEPKKIFNRTSRRAAARFRFQPRTRNGEGIEVPGVRYLFNYTTEG